MLILLLAGLLQSLPGPRRASEQAEAVGPSILHAEYDRYSEDNNKPHQSTIIGQVHEEQKRQRAFYNCHEQHTGEHLLGGDVGVCDHELKRSEDKNTEVNNQILPCATLVCF